MAIKVHYTYTDYKGFPSATEASRRHSIISMAIPLVSLGVFASFVEYNVMLSALGAIAFCALCFLLLKGRYDRDIINGFFLGINEISTEQRKNIVNHFMQGRVLGQGDVKSACTVATLLQKADVEFRNNRITKSEYYEQQRNILSAFGINETCEQTEKIKRFWRRK